MTRNLWEYASIATLSLVCIAGCAEEPGSGNEMTNTAAVAGASNHDEDVDRFLPDYVREDEMFADDRLEYDVSNGLVTVRGTLDNEAERDALTRRIRRVPGVRDVNAAGITVG